MQYVAFTCRFAVAVVFLVAVASKVRNRSAFNAFRSSVRSLVPALEAAATPVTVVVCAAEFAVTVLLTIPVGILFGEVIALLSLAGFTTAIASGLRRGVRAPCRCFGASDGPVSMVHLFRNGMLILLATLGLVFQLASGAGTGARPAGVGLSLAVAAVFAVGLIFIEDFAALFTTAG